MYVRSLDYNRDVLFLNGNDMQVADGIIAPGYEPAALEILKAKKGGKFIVLQAKPDYEAPTGEFREVYGVGFYQDRNSVAFSAENLKASVVGGRG